MRYRIDVTFRNNGQKDVYWREDEKSAREIYDDWSANSTHLSYVSLSSVVTTILHETNDHYLKRSNDE